MKNNLQSNNQKRNNQEANRENTNSLEINSQQINNHYGTNNLLANIKTALTKVGLNLNQLNLDDLAPLDQLHLGGRLASRQLAAKVNFLPNQKLLDLGCGTGGASRLLASEFNLKVTGLDLTQSFIEAANWLTQATGLAQQANFISGDAQKLPLASASFDYVWCQHTLLNLPNFKQGLAEIARVLKPGGKLLLHEVLRGANPEALVYPVPWASNASTSHLFSLEELSAGLAEAGLAKFNYQDITLAATQWRKKHTTKESQASPTSAGLTTEVIFGKRFTQLGKNLMANLAANKLQLIQGVVEKPA